MSDNPSESVSKQSRIVQLIVGLSVILGLAVLIVAVQIDKSQTLRGQATEPPPTLRGTPAPRPTWISPTPAQISFCRPNTTISCQALGGLWTGGTASCRADGSGYDTVKCRPQSQTEMIKPAQRDSAAFSAARCNDGTPFGFELELASADSPNKNSWVISLQGGGLCDDNIKICSQRIRSLITAPRPPDRSIYDSREFTGLLNSDQNENPYFYNANRVFAYYCSSDSWTGETTAPRPTTAGDWYFSGRHNIRALINILKQNYGLNDGNPQTKVLLGGTSAGGCAAFTSGSLLKELLPQVSSDQRLKLLADGCWAPDWDNPDYRLGLASTSDLEAYNRAHSFWGSRMEPACEAAYPDDKGKCFMLKYGYQFIAAPEYNNLPIFIQSSSRDESLAIVNHRIPRNPNHPALIEWKNLMLDEFNRVDPQWLFSSDEIYHAISTKDVGRSDTGWCRSERTTGQRFCDMLNRFWNDDYRRRERAITP